MPRIANQILAASRRLRPDHDGSGSRCKGRMGNGFFGAVALAVLAISAALLSFFPLSAAASPARLTAEEKEQIFKRHEVASTVSPRGIRLDVYDYWITSQGASDSVNPDGFRGMGINHPNNEQAYLIFGKGMRGAGINAWTGSSETREDIVQNRLGEDGYPWIAAGKVHNSTLPGDLTQEQSLKYLFDGSDFAGKQAHMGATGLLQVDDEGYYYYDSKKNFASYDAKKNSFTLYDSPAVTGSGKDDQFGQFFPFNKAKNVFPGTEKDGKLISEIHAYNDLMNHYFGLQLSSNFMQPTDGKTKNGKEMVFEFTGDDDVWVFIDGVLVGDVGGIHDRTGLSINFATGKVVTYDGSSYGNPQTHYTETTIKKMFEKALGDQVDHQAFKGDTFRDGTYHTLQFYYLERGNHNSNMALKFNLASVPESTMTKVDQLGKPVEGAVFDLYATDENYSLTPDAIPLATGRTDAAGHFTFTLGDGSPLSFMKLYADKGYKHYILRERVTPAGHRPSPDGKLKYKVSATDKTLGFILSDNYWDSGVYAHAEQTLGIEGDYVYGIAPENVDQAPRYNVGDGAVFAVIYRRADVAQGGSGNLWHSLSGDAYKGWKMSDDPVTDVSQLRDAQIYTFADDDKDGSYTLDIDDMPGNPEYYYLMTGDADKTKFTVGFYYTTAVSNGKVDKASISATNTHRLPGAQFKRQTAANLYVTDIANVFAVQKVDEQGRPVNGAEFALYSAQDMQGDGLALQPKPDARPVRKETTETQGEDRPVQGEGLCFMERLDPGIYYLVETEAPAGYVKNETATRVLVDAQGVHVDAGTMTDGVTAMVSTGSLVDSMSGFAAADDIDMTLYDILASCDTASSNSVTMNPDGSFAIPWQSDKDQSDDLWLTYGATDRVLDYGPDPNMPNSALQVAYIVPEGLAMCRVRQNGAYMEGEDPGFMRRYGNADWVDLGDRDLTPLYTSATCVVVENKRQPSLTVEKHAQVAPGLLGPTETDSEGNAYSTLPYKQFWMKLTLTKEDGAPLEGVYEASIWEDVDGVPNCVHTFENIQANGGRFYLHDGQTLEVYGLPQDARYKVEEIAFDPAGTNGSEDEVALANPLGFVQVSNSNTEGVVGAGESRASFTNEYQARAALEIPVAKSFNRWDLVKEGFEFKLMAAFDAPVPEDALDDGTAVTVLTGPASPQDGRVGDDLQAQGAFGSITYSKAGKYTYYITEVRPSDPLAGVTYSDAVYRVTVSAADTGSGSLDLSAAWEKLVDDDGKQLEGSSGSLSEGSPLLFTNTFDAEKTGYAPSARKDYIDYSGARLLADGMFSFIVEAPTGAPIPSENGEPAVAEGDEEFVITNKGNAIEARQAWFTDEQVGKTYDYTFFEKMPEDATQENDYTVDGITYDPTVYKASVQVSAGESTTGAKVKVAVTYCKQTDEGTWEDVDEPVFHNECRADPVSLSLGGSKVLRGRNTLDGEVFNFNLKAADEVTAAAIADGSIAVTSSTATASTEVEHLVGEEWNLKASVGRLGPMSGSAPVYSGDFTFPNLAFSRAGEYLFAINEVVPTAGEAKQNMTYDTHTAYAKVNIETDSAGDHGAPTLKATIAYSNGSSSTDEERVVFTNVYQSFCTSASLGLTVKKTLDGRDLHPGEFSFEIAGAPGEGNQQDADAAQAKLLNEADKAFANPRATDGVAIMKGKLEDLSFTQDDAGRTFAYRIREHVPAGGEGELAAPGVVYDRTEYEYRLSPVDNGEGALTLRAELYKVRESDGSSCETLLYSHDPADGEPEAGDDVRVAAFANSYSPAPVTLTDEWCALTKHLKGRAWQEGDTFDFAMERVSYQGVEDKHPQTSGAAFDAMPLPRLAAATDASPDAVDDEGAAIAGVKRFGFEPLTFCAPGTYVYRVREVKSADPLDDVTYSTQEVAVRVEVKDLGVGRLVAYVEVDEVPQGDLAHFTNVYDAGGVPGPPVDPDPDPPVDPDPEPDPDPNPDPGPDPDPDKPVDPNPNPDPDPDKPIDPGPAPDKPGGGGADHGAGEGEDGYRPALPGTGDSSMAVVLGVAVLGVAGIAAGVLLALRARGQRYRDR